VREERRDGETGAKKMRCFLRENAAD